MIKTGRLFDDAMMKNEKCLLDCWLEREREDGSEAQLYVNFFQRKVRLSLESVPKVVKIDSSRTRPNSTFRPPLLHFLCDHNNKLRNTPLTVYLSIKATSSDAKSQAACSDSP